MCVGVYVEQLIVYFLQRTNVPGTSLVGTCSTSTLQQSLLFPVYTYTYISSAVVRSTYCTAVGIRARAVGTLVGTVGT